MDWTLRWAVDYCFVIGDMLDCIINIRVILLKQSRYDEAEALFRQELGIYRYVFTARPQIMKPRTRLIAHSSLV